MADEKFTMDEVKAQLAAYAPEWAPKEGRDAIERKYVFADFKKAFAFMTKVAAFADEKDHHPEWFNVYNRVEVQLATHTANGVTHKDIELAKFMDAAAADFQ